MFTKFNITPSGEIHVQTDSGTIPPLIFPSAYEGHDIAKQIIPLRSAVAMVTERMVALAPKNSPLGYRERTVKEIENISADWRATRTAIIAGHVALADRNARAVNTEGFDKALWPAFITALLSQSNSQRLNTLLQTDDVALLAAAVQAGPDLLNIIPSVWAEVLKHYAILKFLKGPGTSYPPKAPSLIDLCPSQPDWKSIRKQAENLWTELQEADQALIGAERYLGQIIPFFARSCADLSNAEVYEVLAA